MIRMSEIRELTDEELKNKLHELNEELFTLRLKKGAKQELPNPLRFRTIRKEIARIKTLQRERKK